MIQEFKAFIQRGNVLDLAVAVIMGAAFGAIVNSLVNDIIMPPIGLILGGVDFSNLFFNLSGGDYVSLAAAQQAGAATVNYGLFINHLLNFLIISVVVFLLVKAVNNMVQQKKEAEAPPELSVQEKLLTEIRDLLKQRT
ncbi:MAG TPA: large conductance mechanosensitive channel protein MscL [Anaerolineae bacterium]|nr:large conductance mechanosensitive channel protein MscL [Anaerolineae bacterium]HMR63951.1 large conductance mechanosensitive channel protein MscL [Anaerolineae bacterium]